MRSKIQRPRRDRERKVKRVRVSSGWVVKGTGRMRVMRVGRATGERAQRVNTTGILHYQFVYMLSMECE